MVNEDRLPQPPIDPEREALIQEMLRDAKKVELPSELTENPVIHKGDEDLPAPMIVNKVTSAGYVYIWDSRTYEKIPVLYYMLPQILRTRREDGSYRFTNIDPGKKPKRGTHKCLLHKDQPERKHYDELGFATCRKDNLINPYQVTQHMRRAHRHEWATIEAEIKEKERQEDRQFQKYLMGLVDKPEVEEVVEVEPEKEVVEVPKKKTPKPQKAKEESPKGLICPWCKADFTNKKSLERHLKEQHV